MLRALTHPVSPRIADCELTFLSRRPIDVGLAAREHERYCAELAGLGVIVDRLSGNESFPDACFIEDNAVVVDEVAVICSFGVASRRGETALVRRELSKYRDVVQVEPPATIEGGDVLRVGKTVLVGESSRTNARGIEALRKILAPHGYSVVPVRTSGSLHLKSGCTAIDDETLLVNPAWVDTAPLGVFRLVTTPDTEPDSANLLRVGETVCVQAGFPKTAELVGRIAKQTKILDLSELRKAEGALTCSSILFEVAVETPGAASKRNSA